MIFRKINYSYPFRSFFNKKKYINSSMHPLARFACQIKAITSTYKPIGTSK